MKTNTFISETSDHYSAGDHPKGLTTRPLACDDTYCTICAVGCLWQVFNGSVPQLFGLLWVGCYHTVDMCCYVVWVTTHMYDVIPSINPSC
jgi:hypothetical protein